MLFCVNLFSCCQVNGDKGKFDVFVQEGNWINVVESKLTVGKLSDI